jgi:hypothetical protein
VRGPAVVLGLALLGAVALGLLVHPVLALAPLVIPGLPAGLMAWETWRYGDPYDLTLPPRRGRNVGPHE